MRRLTDVLRFAVSSLRVLGRGASGLVRGSREGSLRELLRPSMILDRAEDVPYEALAGSGVRAVLFDLENTLIPPGGPFTAEGREVLRRARGAGLRVGVVTNCAWSWARRALAEEGVVFVAPAHKPGLDGFVAACAMLGVEPQDTVFVGDQLITDVYGAQRAGMRAILVRPRWPERALSSRFQRLVVRALARWLEVA